MIIINNIKNILNNFNKMIFLNLDCGGIIKEPTIITAPLTNKKLTITMYYSRKTNCIWNITAPADKNVVVK